MYSRILRFGIENELEERIIENEFEGRSSNSSCNRKNGVIVMMWEQKLLKQWIVPSFHNPGCSFELAVNS